MVFFNVFVEFQTHTGFATSVPRRSGMAFPFDLPIVSVIGASYVTVSRVVGVCNAGLQGLEWDCCDM